ncbi:MAG: hypothetical protein MR842_05550 [Clostridiales bacterium]|nr:hypothetical protein [Clostridiales bacterium]MDY4008874.1 hypothetical protein [Candidatus Limiplasma sp.]
MTSITFSPARLSGSAPVPPAKSEAHRALLLAALGQGECRLNGFPLPLCDDTLAMMNGVAALGGSVRAADGALYVTPAPAPAAGAPMVECHVNACAAALRMLIPAFLARGQAVRFRMSPALFNRPLDAFQPLLKQIGGRMTRIPAGGDGLATVEISGHMPAGAYVIDGSQSSQFASGLLIALAHANSASGTPAPSVLTVAGPIVSRPYLDMTLRLMKAFHIAYTEGPEGVFALQPALEPSPAGADVAGDWSQAAVFLCMNAMGSGIMVPNLSQNGLQGDAHVADVLRSMGMRIFQTPGGLYAASPSHAGLMPARIDCSNIPDLAPILALTCTQAHGVSVLTGVSRLRLKECDRLAATQELLAQLGAQVESDGDSLTVHGPVRLRGGFEADARGDHRMVMLLAAAALIADAPITVSGVECIAKSWPGFLDAYRQLGGIAK